MRTPPRTGCRAGRRNLRPASFRDGCVSSGCRISILVPAVGISPAGTRLVRQASLTACQFLLGWGGAKRLALVHSFQFSLPHFPPGPGHPSTHGYATEKELIWLPELSSPSAFSRRPGVRCAFQTRDWGVSKGSLWGREHRLYGRGRSLARLPANRLIRRIFLRLPKSPSSTQIHGDTPAFRSPALAAGAVRGAARLPEGDGLATDKPGIGLIIKTADCRPSRRAQGRRATSRPSTSAGAATACVSSNWHRGLLCGRYGPTPAICSPRPEFRPAALGIRQLRQGIAPDFANWFNARDKSTT